MLALLLALSQSTTDISDEVVQDTGAVGVIGFVIVGIIVVIGAAVHRKRRG